MEVRATARRTWLEADLTGPDPDEPAVASSGVEGPAHGELSFAVDRENVLAAGHQDVVLRAVPGDGQGVG